MQPGRGWTRRRGGVVGLAVAFLLFLAPATASAASKDITVENLRVGFVNSSTNNLFKIGAWTPVWVQFKGGDTAFSGEMEIEVPDDNGTPIYFRQTLAFGPGETTKPEVIYTRPGTRDPNFTIRLYEQGSRRPRLTVDGSALLTSGSGRGADGSATGPSGLSPVQAEEALLVTLGKPSGVDLVPALPGFSSDTALSGHELTVARIETTAGLLPARWYGYDAAAAVVLDTNDRDAMDLLAQRGQALVEWVARGGHLVIAVGSNWQAVRDSVLAPILPAVPTGQERLPTLAAIDTFAGSNKPITPAGSPAVFVTKLEQVESRGGKVLSASGNVPLIVRGAHVFGRVTLVGLDTDQKPFSDWPDRAVFWFKAADLRHRAAVNPNSPGTMKVGGGGRLFRSNTDDVSSVLRSALEQFPGVRLVPFGWVAFFIFLYILLIGPGDYLLLKKVFKRMELTWITFPSIVLAVSLIAYLAAYAVKGRELRVNKVDVLDIDQVSGMARGHTFINMFSPQNRDYDVSILPLPMDGPPAPGTVEPATLASTPARAPADTEVLTTWLGVPEAQFGGMGNSGRIGFSAGGYQAMPVGGSVWLENVRVPIWSTKYLTSRWFGPAAAPLAESDLLPAGTDRLNGTVTNRLGIPLEDAILAFGKHVYILGKMAPGVPVRVELAQDRQLAGLLKANSTKYLDGPELASQNGAINRAELMIAVMFHDSRGTTPDGPKTNVVLNTLDMTGQLALDRPMLVGKLSRPAARLVLGNAGVPPKVEQTTIVRMILSLAKK